MKKEKEKTKKNYMQRNKDKSSTVHFSSEMKVRIQENDIP